jgi:pimeloyl-ACP methyl ester carboxylesterase
MVLIDAQGFVDGVGPMASLPTPLAKLGIQVLKSLPLRNSANQMSYFDRESFATDDALKIGRLHCLRPGWENAMLNYMLSGGFSPSKKVSQCEMPTLVLWGRQDGILNGEELAPRFLSELPKAQLRWVEECGHVPHLEQPLVTAQQIAEFLKTDELINKSNQQIFNIPSLTSVKVGAISWIQNITSDVLLPKPMK